MLECQRKETKETEKGLHFKRNDMILIDSLGGDKGCIYNPRYYIRNHDSPFY